MDGLPVTIGRGGAANVLKGKVRKKKKKINK
jgi:hypothetical protein